MAEKAVEDGPMLGPLPSTWKLFCGGGSLGFCISIRLLARPVLLVLATLEISALQGTSSYSDQMLVPGRRIAVNAAAPRLSSRYNERVTADSLLLHGSWCCYFQKWSPTPVTSMSTKQGGSLVPVLYNLVCSMYEKYKNHAKIVLGMCMWIKRRCSAQVPGISFTLRMGLSCGCLH